MPDLQGMNFPQSLPSFLKVTCQYCKKELPRDHYDYRGPCPYCGVVGQLLITVTTHGAGVGDVTIGTAGGRQLDKDERKLWDKLVIFFKDMCIVYGFEIGVPSGIKIIFRVKPNKKPR